MVPSLSSGVDEPGRALQVRDLNDLRSYLRELVPELTFLHRITAQDVERLNRLCRLAPTQHSLWAIQVWFARPIRDRASTLTTEINRLGLPMIIAYLLILFGHNVYIAKQCVHLERQVRRDDLEASKRQLDIVRKDANKVLDFVKELPGSPFDSLGKSLENFLDVTHLVDCGARRVFEKEYGGRDTEIVRGGFPEATRHAAVAIAGLLEEAHTQGSRRWVQDTYKLFAIVGIEIPPKSMRGWRQRAKRT